MREIKFRAVIPERNATIYFDLTDLVHPARKDLFSKRELLIPWLLAGNIPDLYTGLKDCKGADIYEGDIVKTNKDVVFLVIFSPKSARWVGITDNIWTDKPYVGKYIYKNLPWLAERGEITGNIYENPELLKETA